MRRLLMLLLVAFAVVRCMPAQSCTGLCLQQIACPSGGTTSISGTVYAPNGNQPLPNVLVFVPNAAALPAMTPGVSCATPGAAPGGSPLVGTITAADGTFHIDNMPVGDSIPLVIQSGRWRRKFIIPRVTACADTPLPTAGMPKIAMPRTQADGDIPHFAVATGQADQVECVLRKVGLADSEFTNPMDTGRIHIYGGTANRGGAVIDGSTPLRSTLMSDLPKLKQYDVLMLPCEGGVPTTSANELSNLVKFTDAGGRVYASHFSYGWMYRNPPFDSVVNWDVNQGTLPDNTATINPDFYGVNTLTTWLQTVNASTTPGQIALSTIRHDFDGVVPPTQAWITLNDPVHNNPVMQFTFDTPVRMADKCGRVLFNEYHVLNRDPGTPSSYGRSFPTECSGGDLTPQEKLLEYSLFDLTSDGEQPTLSGDGNFGDVYVGFTSAPKVFTWTNRSVFTASVTSAETTGNFAVALPAACKNVPAGRSCDIPVTFTPTAIGPASGTLAVSSNGSRLVANLSGNGIPPIALSRNSLLFGNTDVGFAVAQTLVLQNVASGPVTLLTQVEASDFGVSTNCPAVLAASATCTATVTFKPVATGTRMGRASFNGQPATFSGNGVDFSAAFTPPNGTVIAGLNTTAPMAVLPIAGFNAAVQLSCSTSAPGSVCTMSTGSVIPSASASVSAQITTTSKYTVIGYGGSGTWKLSLFAILAGLVLGRKRNVAIGKLLLWGLLLGGSGWLAGCGSKTPAMNSGYTAPGNYTYTVTATDGFLTHSTAYNLTVAAK